MNYSYVQKNGSAQKTAVASAASVLDSSSQCESLQRHADLTNSAAQCASLPPRPNNTGMPDNLKAGIESLSGFSMDNVRVHYNSSKPATVRALAYTQGTDIHVAPGQEKHLPHEAWHVAQQMAGRVSPTTNINGMPVNDNAALEHEADVMGKKAVQCKKKEHEICLVKNNQGELVQRVPLVKFFEGTHKEKKGAIEKNVDDVVEKKGDQYDTCDDFHIVFETFGNNVNELIELYNGVISNCERKVTVLIGLNTEAFLPYCAGYYESKESYEKNMRGKHGFGSRMVKESDSLASMNIPDRLIKSLGEIENIPVNKNHKIIVYPFIYDGRYKQGGDYNMPYCEIRGVLMQKADNIENVDLYRWIDRDCRDDRSIDYFNILKNCYALRKKINGKNAIFSAAYKWKCVPTQTGSKGGKEANAEEMKAKMVEYINEGECYIRTRFFDYRKEFFNPEELISTDSAPLGKKELSLTYYLPETLLYFTRSAHKAAMNRLLADTKTKPSDPKPAEIEQSGESARAIKGIGSNLHFMSFACTKPLKYRDGKSYFSAVEEILPPKKETVATQIEFNNALKGLRQTAFDEGNWFIPGPFDMVKMDVLDKLYHDYLKLWNDYAYKIL